MGTDDRSLRQFATRLGEAMRAREYNQTSLGAKVGLHQSVISDYLAGKMYPKGENLIPICRVLGVSADWLLMGRGARQGGLAPVGEQVTDGILIAVDKMRTKLAEVEAEARGGTVSLPTPEERARGADLLEATRRLAGEPEVRKRARSG